MNIMKLKTNAILYVRLSREDAYNEVSNSIKNQIDILTNYAMKNGFRVIDICSDDGYSGGNFDRPGFKKMMDYLDCGKANTVIVKDLSRFGRNFIGVSSYIDDYFTYNNIRFISINDNYDSATDEGDISIVFRNFLNGLYLKEFKRKVKQGIDRKAKKETLKFTGCYGYNCVDGKLEIDHNVAPIIVRIFNEFISGKRPIDICRDLEKDGIMSPGEYREKNNICGYKNRWKNGPNWNKNVICKIIRRREYVGDTVNRLHLYNKGKGIKNENPIVIENTHKPIIDRDTFNKAQDKVMVFKRTPKEKYEELICDLLKTKDNKKVYYTYKKDSKTGVLYEFYENKKYNILISINKLHLILYEHSINLIKSIIKNKEKFKNELIEEVLKNSNYDKKIRNLESEISNIDCKISDLFEKFVLEEISFEEYEEESKRLSNLQIYLSKEKNELKNNNKSFCEIKEKIDDFIEKVNKNKLKLKDIELIRFCIKEVIIERKDKKYEFKIIDVFN